MRSQGVFSRVALVLGLVFLYAPILSMIVFSFNNSRLVTVWDAAHSPTLKWYQALFSNAQILGAAFLSIRSSLRPGPWCSVRSPASRWPASGRSGAACCSPA